MLTRLRLCPSRAPGVSRVTGSSTLNACQDIAIYSAVAVIRSMWELEVLDPKP